MALATRFALLIFVGRSAQKTPPRSEIAKPRVWKPDTLGFSKLPPLLYMRENGTICPFGVILPVLEHFCAKINRYPFKT